MRSFTAFAFCVAAVPIPHPGDRRASWRIVPVPASVPRARRLVRDKLAEWEIGDEQDEIALLVSELVTNALCHAWGPIWLAVSYEEGTLRCEVDDANPVLPRVRDADRGDERGRGLQLLDLFSDRWGSERTPTGKVSWFELSVPARSDGTAA
ncbi:ATP-binding protein [Streptosporangium sp. NPDC048865]|uniref:ATP-binding protein n=1 Tax=Streptosporangium sp. NPDC048865 TaxID=3155766 RepID=UPI003435A368